MIAIRRYETTPELREFERTCQPLTVAIAGNPNAGKTSLFNALTGLRQKVANYPGVTVESKTGAWLLERNSVPVRLLDLPGLYSLEATSLDEQIARDIMLGDAAELADPEVIIVAADATNLVRNLYLVTQLLETGCRIVVALTMVDLAERSGMQIDLQKLRERLGVAVVPVIARQRTGVTELGQAVLDAIKRPPASEHWRLSAPVEEKLALLSQSISVADLPESSRRQLARRELFSDAISPDHKRERLLQQVRQELDRNNSGRFYWRQEPLIARYQWIEEVVNEAVHFGTGSQPSLTERIDAIVTHKIAGPLLLLLVMLLVFQTIFSWASLPMNLIDHVFTALGGTVRGHLPPGILTDLLADGVIAGVGGVLVFLPQILLLFFFISVLEDSGYMARAAFLMDRLMRSVGLNGKAFMPLMSSFACAVPGIMATRRSKVPRIAWLPS